MSEKEYSAGPSSAPAESESSGGEGEDQNDQIKTSKEVDDTAVDDDVASGNMSDQHDVEKIDQPAFTLATLGLQRVGTLPPPKPKIQQPPPQLLNARGMPARIRKRNRFFFDENIINDDKPLRMSLSPKKLPLKCNVGPSVAATTMNVSGNAGSGQTVHSKPQLTPSKVLKKRKGVVSRYMRSDDKNKFNTYKPIVKLPLPPGKITKSNSKLEQKNFKLKSSVSNLVLNQRNRHTMTPVKQNTTSVMSFSDTSDVPADQNRVSSAVINRKIGQTIGMRLRNLLKLPKAHKWAIAEWFYSYIDKPLFRGFGEFDNYIRELYPGLKTRYLTRYEWKHIRRSMGKPRRCSQAFFDEERRELERKRLMLRTLQTRKPGEMRNFVMLLDMPDKIPMPLPIGTKVTARLRSPQDGIFSGSVDAYDSQNSIYRVTFDRPGLGTHSIPDFEIVSENFHEMLPLHTFTKDFRPNLMSIFHSASSMQSPQKPTYGGGIIGVRTALNMKLNKSDPLLGQEAIVNSPFKTQLLRHHDYPVKLLENLVRLKRAVNMKRAKVKRLSEMNDEAELQATSSRTLTEYASNDCDNIDQTIYISEEFQRRYASNIISIEKINSDIMSSLNDVQKLSNGLSQNPHVQAMIAPTFLREQCRESADKAVDRLNNGQIKDERMVKLIKNLTTLLMIASRLGGEQNGLEVSKVLEGCMEEVRSNLISRENIAVFQKNVQIHLHHMVLDIRKNSAQSQIKTELKSNSKTKNEECEDKTAPDEHNDIKKKEDDELEDEGVDYKKNEVDGDEGDTDNTQSVQTTMGGNKLSELDQDGTNENCFEQQQLSDQIETQNEGSTQNNKIVEIKMENDIVELNDMEETEEHLDNIETENEYDLEIESASADDEEQSSMKDDHFDYD